MASGNPALADGQTVTFNKPSSSPVPKVLSATTVAATLGHKWVTVESLRLQDIEVVVPAAGLTVRTKAKEAGLLSLVALQGAAVRLISDGGYTATLPVTPGTTHVTVN